MTRRRCLIVIIVAIIVIGVIFLVINRVYRDKSKLSNAGSFLPKGIKYEKPPENWETYQDPYNQFEVSYPNNWKVDNQSLVYGCRRGVMFTVYSPVAHNITGYEKRGAYYSISFNVWKYSEKSEPIDVVSPGVKNSDQGEFYAAHIPGQEAVELVELSNYELEKRPEYKFAQTIIHSVKIKPEPDLNCQTYLNNEYKFSFKYSPNSYVVEELKAAPSDYLSNGGTRKFIKISSLTGADPIRLYVYPISMEEVIKNDPEIRQKSNTYTTSRLAPTGLTWVAVGFDSGTFLIERNGNTYVFDGNNINYIMDVFEFIK